MADSGSSEQAWRVEATAWNLRVDAATAEVLSALDAAGIRGVLLKGPALAAWYADEPMRAYLDCDLWVGPRDVAAAGNVLTRLGFTPDVDERGLPAWWQQHASTWSRDLDGVVVDLHRHLQGVGVDDETAWKTLSGSSEELTVAGYPATVLPVPARLLFATLHAAHHGKRWSKGLMHVEQALVAANASDWRQAALLADRLRATDAFATGLRLVPAGAALADRLALPHTHSIDVALHASTPPPIALGFEQLARAATVREFGAMLLRKVVPPVGFMRYWWPPAARNTRMLALGYIYRPLWLLRHAPRGLRAWLAARRTVRRGTTL